jgi:hypothetical protein
MLASVEIVASAESLLGSLWFALALGLAGLIGGAWWCRKQKR